MQHAKGYTWDIYIYKNCLKMNMAGAHTSTWFNLKSSFRLWDIYVLYQVYTLHNLPSRFLLHTYRMFILVLVF